jgi:hypothetical protein
MFEGTEEEWLAGRWDMYYHKACRSPRKRRLLACCHARRVLPSLEDPRFQNAVELSERYADGEATAKELTAERRKVKNLGQELYSEFINDQPQPFGHTRRISLAYWGIVDILAKSMQPYRCGISAWEERRDLTRSELDRDPDDALQLEGRLVREVFGNPFRPVTLDPAWNNAAVVKLAQSVYDERDLPSGHFDNGRITILADALEEAGCTNTDVLDHCRSPGPHVRGCWLVDLILGKE